MGPRRAPPATLFSEETKTKVERVKINKVDLDSTENNLFKMISQGPTVTVTVSMHTRPPRFCKVRFQINKGNHQRFGVG